MTTAEAMKAVQGFARAYRRLVRSPSFQALIRADYAARMAQLPWWRLKERRELTRRFRLLSDDAPE